MTSRVPTLWAATLLLAFSATACSSDEPEAPSGSPTESSAPAAPEEGQAGDGALGDPMQDLAQGDAKAIVGDNAAIVNERGDGQGEFAVPVSPAGSEVVVTVSCAGPGRFTVESAGELVLSSACTGRAQSMITISAENLGKAISVEAPGQFWLAVVPAL